MVFFCPEEIRGRGDLRHDRLLKDLLAFFLRAESSGLLVVIVMEDDGAVLFSHIRALTVELGGIMDVPENFQEVIVGDDLGVKLQVDDLGVAGITLAHAII